MCLTGKGKEDTVEVLAIMEVDQVMEEAAMAQAPIKVANRSNNTSARTKRKANNEPSMPTLKTSPTSKKWWNAQPSCSAPSAKPNP